MTRTLSVNAAASQSNGAAIKRCAVYTRKSSEEGLEQEFNSLDAQREACEAYILSQKGAGWIALPDMYDDGGISGGTMERPALQRLLADIQAGRVDTVVVYKVDRLTRSLSDFARIVDAFDAKAVSFVSVTQQFNTTTSMGRLTLNMLLSFAQFEREVTGERIRDKIAASKQKGMWMGGLPPLGYDAVNRKLVVNPAEADTVCHIFRRYAALRSVRELSEDLNKTGVVSKARKDRLGQPAGGKPFARGALYHMLQNRIYRGEIVHKDRHYSGQHDAIVDAALWHEVQATLASNRVERAVAFKAAAPSLLAGLVYDEAGERMSPTHTNKTGTRYRYYVSQSLIIRSRTRAVKGACRVPAADFEAIVEDRVCALLRDDGAVYDAVNATSADMTTGKALIEAAFELAERWPSLRPSEKRAILRILLARVDVRVETVDIAVRLGALLEIGNAENVPKPTAPSPDAPVTVLSVPTQILREETATKLLIEGPAGLTRKAPDRALLRLLGQARRFTEMVLKRPGQTMREHAAKAGVTPSYFTRVFRLGFLAPDITTAIIQGRQPRGLTANKLLLAGKIAPTWSDQRSQLGIG